MATTSQKMIEIKFFVRIRGARTPPPIIEDPVIKIPLKSVRGYTDGGRLMFTMQLQRLIILCKDRCLNLPKREVIHLRGIVRPEPNIKILFYTAFKRGTYIESFSVTSEEHICEGQSKHSSQKFKSYKPRPQPMPCQHYQVHIVNSSCRQN